MQIAFTPLPVLTDILHPKGAGKNGNTTVFLAPSGGKSGASPERGLN